MTPPNTTNLGHLHANSEDSDALRSLMDAVGIPSFRELSRRANVSLWQVQQLRHGHVDQMRLAPLLKLSRCLEIPLSELIEILSEQASSLKQHQDQDTQHIHSPEDIPARISHHQPHPSDQDQPNTENVHGEAATLSALQAEYDRLQQQINQQREQAIAENRRSALEILESWMLQWPTAAHAAQKNDTIPASRLIPLVRPMERLLDQWDVEAIAAVGEDVAYDPTIHQLMNGAAQPGDSVRVRYVGYRHQGKLLHRAKVSPA